MYVGLWVVYAHVNEVGECRLCWLDSGKNHVVENCPGKEPLAVTGSKLQENVVCRRAWIYSVVFHALGKLKTVAKMTRVGGGHELDGVIGSGQRAVESQLGRKNTSGRGGMECA